MALMASTRIDNGRLQLQLHQLQDGTGTPLLCLHALGGSAADFAPALPPWSGPIHALDFSGHGHSGRYGATGRSARRVSRLAGTWQRIASCQIWGLEYPLGYRALLSPVRENADLLVRAYEAGELDLTALLVQTDRIFRMNLAYFDALLAYHEALAQLEQAVGGRLPAAAQQ